MGARLTGYTSTGGLHPEEAKGLRIASSLLLGEEPPTKSDVVRTINAKGYRTSRGSEWRTSVLMRTLLHPRMAGLDEDGNPIEGHDESVLTVDEYNQLTERYGATPEDEEQATPRPAYDYLATNGLSLCDQCRYAMVGARVTGDADPSYRCPPPAEGRASCGRVRMTADRLETAVGEQVAAELLRPGVREQLAQLQEDIRDEVSRLRAHVQGADQRFAELGDMYGRGLLVKAAFLAAQQATKQDLKETRVRLRLLEQVAELDLGQVTDVVAWWNSAPQTSRRALVGLVAEVVYVLPSGHGPHDPHERINILWRTAS
ncbi:zinc ribbon domain-containing protein [Streptomyces sp. NPDC004111]|uniref:zinc ribbon domain-containing protein n=1 Tax=Streptomyces sp. NPDC004111 TaxID=3364690 RepID=UPI0036736C26